MSLTIEPASATVPAAGGVITHTLTNGGAAKVVFKVKSSNNNEYRLKPVFGFVDPSGSAPLEITRLAGAPKEDKMVIEYADVPADAPADGSAQDIFKGVAASAQKLQLAVKAE